MIKHSYHLVKRFFGALSNKPISSDDQLWVQSHLHRNEYELWSQLVNHDQRHAVGVARRVATQIEQLNIDSDGWIEVALMHDIGKLPSRIGVGGRVCATLLRALTRPFGTSPDSFGPRVSSYLRHGSTGATLIAAANGSPAAIEWSRSHHGSITNSATRPPSVIPENIAKILKEADDD